MLFSTTLKNSFFLLFVSQKLIISFICLYHRHSCVFLYVSHKLFLLFYLYSRKFFLVSSVFFTKTLSFLLFVSQKLFVLFYLYQENSSYLFSMFASQKLFVCFCLFHRNSSFFCLYSAQVFSSGSAIPHKGFLADKLEEATKFWHTFTVVM